MKITKPPIEDLFDLTVNDCEKLIQALISAHGYLNEKIKGQVIFTEEHGIIFDIETALKKSGCTFDSDTPKDRT